MSKAPPRPSISAARRARIFAAHSGICGISGAKIGPNDLWDVEHRIPWAISFDDGDGNLYPALRDPHKNKTKADLKAIAKLKRIEARHNGTRRERKPIPSRPFQKPEEKKPWPKRPNPWGKKNEKDR